MWFPKLVFPVLMISVIRAADRPQPSQLPEQEGTPKVVMMSDGSIVDTVEEWEKKRAPELRDLFQTYMYGKRPSPVRGGDAKVIREDKSALGSLATLREIEVNCGLPKPVHLLLVVPNSSGGKKVPCFLGLNFRGNQQLLDDPLIHAADGQEGRGKEKEWWSLEQTVKRGYAVASFYCGDIVPDDKVLAPPVLAKFSEGPESTGALMAWAWGLSRMIDHLETVDGIDAKRIAVVGHSRMGKAALLATAFDPRIALCIPSQAGCGGTAPSRVPAALAVPNEKGRPTVETVTMITRNFPYWFCPNFKEFAGHEAKLPFEQHALIALCAPRPVLIGTAEDDPWSYQDGQYEMLKAATPVYALYGHPMEFPPERPAVGTLLKTRLGFFMRPGKHSMNAEDWSYWADYADEWLKVR